MWVSFASSVTEGARAESGRSHPSDLADVMRSAHGGAPEGGQALSGEGARFGDAHSSRVVGIQVIGNRIF